VRETKTETDRQRKTETVRKEKEKTKKVISDDIPSMLEQYTLSDGTIIHKRLLSSSASFDALDLKIQGLVIHSCMNV
jgi:hypothetical protein